MQKDGLKIGHYELSSRLIVGTGKYPSFDVMVKAHEASGAQMITVAMSRVKLDGRPEENILNYIDRSQYVLLPNTAGAYTAEDAIRIARLSRASGAGDLVKVEVIGDPKTLMPDVVGLLEATKVLVKEGFTVMPYTTDDPVMAKKLEDAGAACVMPLAAPIGSGRGIQNRLNLKFILEAVSCPVIVDAGVGVPSDAAICMELGAHGVLMNTAIAASENPVLMAEAMRDAVAAGHKAFLAGRMAMKEYAAASSPQEGLKLIKN
ncbi:MAG: thiazole synthase [Candidatus Omnitrophica bacterium]|nr:thiazole synthase [Candidatus Omnitrophota bacterium]